MEGLLITIIGAVLVQGAAMWYKVGRLEAKIEDICGRLDRGHVNNDPPPKGGKE